MLPGDYIAMKMTGRVCTTLSSLSEGIMWDFKTNSLATALLDYYGIEESIVPTRVENFNEQGRLHNEASKATGLTTGIPVTYRAGDQPNNAMSLNVLNPGEVAASGEPLALFTEFQKN